MSDGTLETIDGRPALRFERRLEHSVQRVWRAVSVPAELERWFPAAAEWTPAVGETFEAAGMTGEVTEVDEPHRLAWTFNGEHYSFELSAQDGGCLLVFVHVFDDRCGRRADGRGLGHLLHPARPAPRRRLPLRAEAHEPWEEIHERYAESFGIDPAPGRAFAASLRSGG